MDLSSENTRAHVLALLIVGGVMLFAFVLTVAITVLHFLFTHRDILVLAFTALFVAQAYWILFAFLKRRFRRASSDEV